MNTQSTFKQFAAADREPSIHSGAEFSDCGRYRYALWRTWCWRGDSRRVMFIGLNPSTADAVVDDPTIRRCVRFAKSWGFDGMLMLNAFAFRATDPKDMLAAADPVGPENDEAIGYRMSRAEKIIAAWGSNCPSSREQAVLRAVSRTVYCLGRTKNGKPKHPLYLRSDTRPEIFWSPEQ